MSGAVLMTRTTDVAVSLQARVDLANNWPAERFVSIHQNAFSDPAANGTETYSFSNGTAAAHLRDRVQEELVQALGLLNRGPKTANFFVLRETFMPAVLSEGGFITNPGDAAVLATPAGRQASAEAHLFGLQRHFGFPAYLPFPEPANYCVAKQNSAGCTPGIEVTQPPSLSANATIFCHSVVAEQFGILVWSTTQAAVPFGGGVLCLGGTLHRTSVTSSGGFPSLGCDGRLNFVVTPAWLSGQGLVVGSEVFAQWWYRDPALAVDPIGLSDGLRFIVRP